MRAVPRGQGGAAAPVGRVGGHVAGLPYHRLQPLERHTSACLPMASLQPTVTMRARGANLPCRVAMPEISRFFGIIIRMYFDDHLPPHFHAIYQGQQAEISIDSLGLLAGRLPGRALALVVEWASQHQAELRSNWERLHSAQSPERIAPLE